MLQNNSNCNYPKSRKEVWFWRIVIFFLIIVSFQYHSSKIKSEIKEDCIIRTKLDKFIIYDEGAINKISDWKDNKHVKGVLLIVDSGGGSFIGSESLYKSFKDFRTTKPVVVSVRNAAASGAYMVAMTANHIVAYEGSTLGSIGIISEFYDITEAAKKLGINLVVKKSSPLKGVPNPWEKLSEDGEKSIDDDLANYYSIFKGYVKKSRPNIKDFDFVCNGAIYNGTQGLQNGLIDSIGTEKDALNILKEKNNIPTTTKVVDVELLEYASHSDGDSFIDKIIRMLDFIMDSVYNSNKTVIYAK